MVENVLQINGGITINIDMSVKNVMYVKKIIKDYKKSIMDDSVVLCNEIIE